MSLSYYECRSECLQVYTLSLYTLTCTATDFRCVCAITSIAERLLDTSKAGGCIIESCLSLVQSLIVSDIASTCSEAQLYLTLDSANPLAKFLPTYSDLSTATSGSPKSTSTIASTSAFVPTTVFTSATTAPAQPSTSTDKSTSIFGIETEAPNSSVPVASSALNPKVIGGIVAGATIVSLAAVACMIWFILRRRKNSDSKKEQDTIDQPRPEHEMSQGGATENPEAYPQDMKVIYQHQNTIQELPGDDPPQSPMISELDSIRPVSELEYIAYNGDRAATTPGARVVSPILPNIAEMREGNMLSLQGNVALPAQDGDDDAIPNLTDNNHAAGQRTDETFLPASPPTSS